MDQKICLKCQLCCALSLSCQSSLVLTSFLSSAYSQSTHLTTPLTAESIWNMQAPQQTELSTTSRESKMENLVVELMEVLREKEKERDEFKDNNPMDELMHLEDEWVQGAWVLAESEAKLEDGSWLQGQAARGLQKADDICESLSKTTTMVIRTKEKMDKNKLKLETILDLTINEIQNNQLGPQRGVTPSLTITQSDQSAQPSASGHSAVEVNIQRTKKLHKIHSALQKKWGKLHRECQSKLRPLQISLDNGKSWWNNSVTEDTIPKASVEQVKAMGVRQEEQHQHWMKYQPRLGNTSSYTGAFMSSIASIKPNDDTSTGKIDF